MKLLVAKKFLKVLVVCAYFHHHNNY